MYVCDNIYIVRTRAPVETGALNQNERGKKNNKRLFSARVRSTSLLQISKSVLSLFLYNNAGIYDRLLNGFVSMYTCR